MDSRRNSNSSTAFVVIVIVIIVILVITAGLKNSARPWRIQKRVNMTASSHQRGRSSPILVSSIKIASSRNNRTAAVMQSLNKAKPKWNPNNPRPHTVQRRPFQNAFNNQTLKAIEPAANDRSYLNGSRVLPLPRNTG
uniref:Uncharacterized protein n=1 Tax=Daphnia galeata TaxID=27404 RepID=A0A8J2RFX5_9CRUS|nr:unnamed protein product [Daphnia galeata]